MNHLFEIILSSTADNIPVCSDRCVSGNKTISVATEKLSITDAIEKADKAMHNANGGPYVVSAASYKGELH